MKLEEKDGLRILTPEEGHLLKRNGEDNNFSEIVYLGKNDSPENYTELSNEQINKLLKQDEDNTV